MTGYQPSRAVAWRCPRCTRLTIRLDHQDPPLLCDHGCGTAGPPLEPIPLRQTVKRW